MKVTDLIFKIQTRLESNILTLLPQSLLLRCEATVCEFCLDIKSKTEEETTRQSLYAQRPSRHGVRVLHCWLLPRLL